MPFSFCRTSLPQAICQVVLGRKGHEFAVVATYNYNNCKPLDKEHIRLGGSKWAINKAEIGVCSIRTKKQFSMTIGISI